MCINYSITYAWGFCTQQINNCCTQLLLESHMNNYDWYLQRTDIKM
jgi:hypothetical protein